MQKKENMQKKVKKFEEYMGNAAATGRLAQKESIKLQKVR